MYDVVVYEIVMASNYCSDKIACPVTSKENSTIDKSISERWIWLSRHNPVNFNIEYPNESRDKQTF